MGRFPMKVCDIRPALEEERQSLLVHPLYSHLQNVESLRLFMEHHVWAVYDFMCLAKRLQRAFTPTGFPWKPPREPEIARLMNEIILGEETDVGPDGTAGSHFDFYLEAMSEVGADPAPVQRYLQALEAGRSWQGSLQNSGAPSAGAAFARETLESIETHNLAYVTGAFTFGRETLIPDLFLQFVRSLNTSHPGQFTRLVYYFQRHIEVDGEEHGPLALKMLEKTVSSRHGTVEDALEGAQMELLKRMRLWNAILEILQVPARAAS